jgi:hypothetical protein
VLGDGMDEVYQGRVGSAANIVSGILMMTGHGSSDTFH